MKMWMVVTFQFEAVHRKNDAGLYSNFLSKDHRHMFKVKVWMEQPKGARRDDFHGFRMSVAALPSHWQGKMAYLELGNSDCEDIAIRILNAIRDDFGYKNEDLRIEVFEDGENGAVLEA